MVNRSAVLLWVPNLWNIKKPVQDVFVMFRQMNSQFWKILHFSSCYVDLSFEVRWDKLYFATGKHNMLL